MRATLPLNTNTRLHGGWKVGASVLVESFGYPSGLYADYALEVPGPAAAGLDTVRSPRLKLEYQLSRPIFLRLVGEYTSERRDALRDDTRTGAPILIFDAGTNTYVRTTPFGRRSFRGDFLFSYQPNPGTVLLPATEARFATRASSAGPASCGLRTGSSSS